MSKPWYEAPEELVVNTPWLGNDPEEEPEIEPEDLDQEEAEETFVDAFCPDEDEAE